MRALLELSEGSRQGQLTPHSLRQMYSGSGQVNEYCVPNSIRISPNYELGKAFLELR